MGCVGWLEAGLLAPDALSRFPYEEHPFNIALVLALADELGIESDYALKEMADRVVPDLGVLKTYPPALVDGRQLEFVNGMSANERLGTLTNWERMGFNRHDPRAEPGVFITCVVNNRADRVARSRVFAGVIVNDLRADRFFLIGSNLDGLYSMIRAEWDETMRSVSLWSQSDPKAPPNPSAIFDNWLRRLRIAAGADEVRQRLHAMLTGLKPGLPADELSSLWNNAGALNTALAPLLDEKSAGAVLAHTQRFAEEQTAAAAFAAKLPAAGSKPDAALDRELHALLWSWFNRRVVIVHDFHASGNQIVQTVADETPPGYFNRVMGVQNIKGTGLNWVYSWQDWAECAKYAGWLESGNPRTAEAGLRGLAGFQGFNLLGRDHLRQVLARVRASVMAQRELFQTELAVIEARLSAAMQAMDNDSSGGKGLRWEQWINNLEAFLDAGDAVQRRKQANRIYKDLATDRISHARAAAELLDLNKRQKGGWLLRRLQGFLKQTV